MQQEVVLAMLAKEPAHGYRLRARLDRALGPLGDSLNAGHIYVTLSRLERTGLVTSERTPARRNGPTESCTRSPPPARTALPSGWRRWIGPSPTWRSST